MARSHGWARSSKLLGASSPDGDVIITLPPQCFMGTATDGSRSQDVAIPLSLVRWVAARYPQGGGQSEGSSS